jgi:hypothetical protein
MNTFSRTISQIWVMFAALSGFGLVLALFMHGYSLKRKVVHGGDGAEKLAEALVLEDYVKAYSTSGHATLDDTTQLGLIRLQALWQLSRKRIAMYGFPSRLLLKMKTYEYQRHN